MVEDQTGPRKTAGLIDVTGSMVALPSAKAVLIGPHSPPQNCNSRRSVLGEKYPFQACQIVSSNVIAFADGKRTLWID